jgi:deazaflavin-dependent oxidoreductase (nitroreductase family)
VHLPRVLARINRRVTNPLQRHWAGRIPFHGIIEHIGRKSGRAYRTPVLAFRNGEGFAFIVGYGTQSDWLRNVLAAGGGHVVHRGHRYRITNPRLLSGPEGLAQLPAPMSLLLRLVRTSDVLSVDATR